MNSKARQIFVTNLKREMRRTGKTQSDISRALNIPLSTVSSWHSGASYPRVDKMQALADYFRVSMRDLTDDMSASDHPVLRIPRLLLHRREHRHMQASEHIRHPDHPAP